ncbi:disease resistance protein RPV1 isoform X2 [Pyrus x bretschneideri]|uniref:disease resistance protein RPV1 isoform X2 n=1 Tax=Pyrus x bretschneideri TaxID=225117 RepID=UPI002030AF24|nr:disease resistance protein RPV1 isoform X2 [Pyrus x bretschneideri]
MDAFRDSSSSSYRCSYHAFLSFRGQDTRKGFTDHLYRALELAGIHTFRDDDEIKRGENIESELEKAIQESQVSIIVFSKDYASSRWCLNELLKIVERRNTDRRHVVLPVFYDVDPSDVRKQSGSFAEAFARHEERFSTEEMDKVELWRRALRDVASLGGMVLGDRYEGQFIQDIVEEIRKKVDHAALDVAHFPVGMDNRVRRLNMWLQDGSIDVGVAVICGMGGIGKSTIAKAAYNRNFDGFQGSSFLADIRESSEQPSGFVGLQRKLLSDIQKGKAKKVYNMDEGTIRIKQAVGYKKVLIVLDDVSNRDQLKAILGMREWLHPGSKIIITTRHEHLLNAHEVFEKFMVRELGEDESLELFSWHAFRQSHPEEGYMELSRHVVQHCGGLPLALQVLGSSLSGKSVEVWQSALQKFDVIPNDKIQKVLRISFDSLQDDHDKNLFLHIASFFTGKKMDYTSTILDSLEFYTRIGIENLVDRCLVKIQRNRLVMHQLVRDMAMEVIREESPDDPGKRSRVLQKDASNILRKLSGTENVKGLMLNLACNRTLVGSDKQRCHVEDYDENSSRRSGLGFFSWKPISFSSTNSASASNEIDFKPEAFRRMHNLEILMLNNVNVRGSYEEFPKSLICLSWRGFHLKSVPENFYLENLVVLDMRNSSLQHVWNGIRFLPRLRILNLSHSHGLRTTPDFLGLPNLERLILKHCINLVEVDESIGYLEKLVVLNLEGCKNLMKLPKLRSIQDLILSGCSKLVLGANTTATTDHLQSTACEMKKLILLSPKSWYSIWSSVSPRKNIESSSFSLASLPHSLTSLRLDRCNLSEIPSALTMLPSLEYLDLNNNPFTSLPESINNLVKLCTLVVEGCRNLTMLPELPHSLKELNGRGCTSLKRITNLPNLHISPATHSLSDSIVEPCLKRYNILLDSNLWYCGKLVDVASLFNTLPLSSFDIKLLKDIDLFDLKPTGGVEVLRNNYCASRRSKGTFECGIFSICVHESKIPDRFNYRSMGNTVFSIIVPSQPNIKVVGLNACILYARQSDRSPEIARGHHRHSLELRNETKGLKWRLRLSKKVEWKVMNEDMLWLTHWIMGNNELECGEEVCFEIIDEQDGFLTKEIGVQFVYEQQNKDKEDIPSSSEDAIILRCRWPWWWNASFAGPGYDTSPWNWVNGTTGADLLETSTDRKRIHNCEKESISTVVCEVRYHLCNHEVIDPENDSRMTP